MAVVHKVIQDFGRMALDPLEILGSPIYVSIDGADIHEDAVSETHPGILAAPTPVHRRRRCGSSRPQKRRYGRGDRAAADPEIRDRLALEAPKRTAFKPRSAPSSGRALLTVARLLITRRQCSPSSPNPGAACCGSVIGGGRPRAGRGGVSVNGYGFALK